MSRFMQNWIPSSWLFGSRFACAQAMIFFAKLYSINAGVTSIVLWIVAWKWRTSSFRNPNQNRAALWRVFSSNERVPANRKTEFYANPELNKQEVGFIFAWSGSELWTLIKYSRSKIKKLKTYNGWCPFKGLSNDTTHMQIQSGRMVPLKKIESVCKNLNSISVTIQIKRHTWIVLKRMPFVDFNSTDTTSAGFIHGTVLSHLAQPHFVQKRK
jgi:hypothetical protein